MTNLIIGIVCYLFFLTSGILLLCNKAHFLIAGFNTASKEEQAGFDKRKLGIVTGTFLIIFSNVLLNFVLGLHYLSEFKNIYTTVFISTTIIGTLLTLILANTWCKTKRQSTKTTRLQKLKLLKVCLLRDHQSFQFNSYLSLKTIRPRVRS